MQPIFFEKICIFWKYNKEPFSWLFMSGGPWILGVHRYHRWGIKAYIHYLMIIPVLVKVVSLNFQHHINGHILSTWINPTILLSAEISRFNSFDLFFDWCHMPWQRQRAWLVFWGCHPKKGYQGKRRKPPVLPCWMQRMLKPPHQRVTSMQLHWHHHNLL